MKTKPTEKYVTKSEASRRIGIHRPALDRILARPGAPSPNGEKRYQLAALVAFAASQDVNRLDNLRDARLEEVRLRCEKLRRELAAGARETVKLADVNDLHGRMASGLRSLLYSKLENEMPPKLAGCDALAIRKYGRELADELVGRLAHDVAGWGE